ncbi:hypothetical protein TIFTF001_029664 [Ficus carica]|uniref:Uncharacterized protein n=1 Tax=Ficus carica TaxID=3494 RepID=A0AA88DSW8_FICCA|nr:hypothetical protein TIFTF001_029664 [Ficus carica]
MENLGSKFKIERYHLILIGPSSYQEPQTEEGYHPILIGPSSYQEPPIEAPSEGALPPADHMEFSSVQS